MIDHPVRLAVFDIDGTLINRAHPLGERQINALRGLHESGIAVALASSRQRASLLDLAAIFDLPLYLVSYNGPLVNAPDGTRIAATEIDIPADLGAVLATYVAAGGCVHVYTIDGWQAYGPDWRIDNEATGGGVTPTLRRAEVEAKTGFKRAHIYNLIKQGQFPKPMRLGVRAVGWDSREIDEWIAERLKARV